MTPEFIIRRLNLEPLTIEGGMYRLFYRATEQVSAPALMARYGHPKALANAICYLHQPDTCSVLHRLRTDEIYHYYGGDPVTLLLLYPDGRHETHVLGTQYAQGQEPFFVVPNGVWQGSRLNEGGAWALIGCSLAPAYDDDDLELGDRDALCREFPAAATLIRGLTAASLPDLLRTDPQKASRIRIQTA